jgi:hypothetical protein
MNRLNKILIEEKTSGLANNRSIQIIQQAIDKKEKITFKDFIDSGVFVPSKLEFYSEVVRYMGGLYIFFDKEYYAKDGSATFRSSSLKDVEKWLWDNVADKKINS